LEPGTHLERAPIVEAVIDLRATLVQGTTLDRFDPLRSLLQDQYPEIKEMGLVHIGARLSSRGETETMSRQEPVGLAFKSADGKRIAQYRIDGFTFNWLQPYGSWEELIAEAWSNWLCYLEHAKPEKVTRIAVRFINRIELPGACRYADYLNDPPVMPPGLDEDIASYFKRATIRGAQTKMSATITQLMENMLDAKHPVLILDIDAFRAEDCDPHAEEIPEVLAALRELKNRIFFGSLTNRALEVYR
jgi:uncharacterized protein (TIGR04255 family)